MRCRTFAEALAAAEVVVAKSPAGLGAALAHCAQSIEYSLTGYPTQRSWVVRTLIGPRVLRKFLRQGFMSHDLKAPIPGAPGVPEGLPASEGLQRLRAAIERFGAHTGPLAPHFAYGPVARADYEAVQAMHVADHLSSFEA